MVEDHVANEPKDNAEIGIQGFYFNFFYERERGEGEGYNKFPYSLMPIEIWNVGWEE